MPTRALFCVLFLAAPTLLAQQLPSFATPIRDPIVVWKVGSPHTGEVPNTAVPRDLQLRADQLSTSIQVQSFPAKGFADALFRAFAAHEEPDILSFDNIGVLDGITTDLGTFTGIRSSPAVAQALVEVTNSLRSLTTPRGGWQYLFTTSKNYALTRELALQPAACDAATPPPPIPPEVQPLSVTLAGAYLAQSPALEPANDPDRLIAPGTRAGPLHVDPSATLHVDQSTNCGYWGNERLVFASLISTYETPKAIGQMPVLLVLRKRDAQWRLLAASADPVSTSTFLRQPAVAPLLQSRPAMPDGPAPAPAQILSPPDGQVPAPPQGQRFGNFTWQPSASPSAVLEIAEFAYQNDARLFTKVPAPATPVDPAAPDFTGEPPKVPPAQVSAGQLWTTRSTWKWRIWSITPSGQITFSETHTFPH